MKKANICAGRERGNSTHQQGSPFMAEFRQTTWTCPLAPPWKTDRQTDTEKNRQGLGEWCSMMDSGQNDDWWSSAIDDGARSDEWKANIEGLLSRAKWLLHLNCYIWTVLLHSCFGERSILPSTMGLITINQAFHSPLCCWVLAEFNGSLQQAGMGHIHNMKGFITCKYVVREWQRFSAKARSFVFSLSAFLNTLSVLTYSSG